MSHRLRFRNPDGLTFLNVAIRQISLDQSGG